MVSGQVSVRDAGLVQAALTVVGTVLRTAGQVVTARLLGATAFGVFAVARNAGELLSKLPDRGSRLAVIGQLPRRRAEGDAGGAARVARDAIVRTALTGTVLAAAVLVVLGASGQLTVALALGVILAPVLALVGMYLAVLQAEHRLVVGTAVFEVVQPGLFLAALAVVWAVDPSALGALAALVASMLVAAVALAALTRRVTGAARVRAGDSTTAADALAGARRSSRALFSAQLSLGAMQGLDVLLVGALVGPAPAGVYAVAVRLVSLSDLVHRGVEAAAGPRLAHSYADGDRTQMQRLVDTTIRVAFPVTVAFGGLLVLAGRPLLGLFGAEFVEGYRLVLILLVAALVNTATGPSGYVMATSDAVRLYAAIMVGHAAAFALLGSGLAAVAGAEGVAWAKVATTISWNVVLVVWARQRLGLWCLPRLPGRRVR